jgi:ATP-dependent exoDNAse (exonuclease V) alpha subunit
MDLEHIELNPQFEDALEALEHSSGHLFISGNAGTGKSTLLSFFRHHTEKSLVVLAPTGVSALNVAGETIHSFFKFRPSITPEHAQYLATKVKNNLKYIALDAIVIDEISMVRADLMDCIDIYLRTVLKSKAPFGGKQLICFGDLYQLPPILTEGEKQSFLNEYESSYFFSAHSFSHPDMQLHNITLEKIYRQEDRSFIDLLNGVRDGSITDSQLMALNSRTDTPALDSDDGYIYLTTTNKRVDQINLEKLQQLGTSLCQFNAQVEGEFEKKLFPTEKTLNVKLGAQVMFLNNDTAKRWVNGSIGHITDIEMDEITVQLTTGETVLVNPHTWKHQIYSYNDTTQKISQKTLGKFTQYPIKLAWAITIHKSQGKTFERVVLDMQWGAFSAGQTYVALSRCRSLDGLILVKPIRRRDIITNQDVEDFTQQYAQQTSLF